MRKQHLWSVLGALALAACSDSASPIPSQCNPLGGEGCLLPWPSATYEVADSSTVTGFRLDIPIEGMPKNVNDTPIDPSAFNRWDGFSAVAPMLAQFPNGVSGANLPSWKDPSKSLAADSPIVVLDMDTGERALFFAEVDQNITDVTKQSLIIRPLARLHNGHRYAVAIRNTVLDSAGAPLEPSPGFKAIRDGGSYDHPRWGALQKRYKDIFAALATAGVDKSELVLAWDFTVASQEYLTSDLMTMKAAALPAMGTNGANLSFVATAQPPVATVYKSYLGTFKSPNFLTDGENDDSILMRGADHLPQMSGLRDARFAALIPDCVATQPLPRPVIIFGHGLLGSAQGYLSNQFTINLAEKNCFIIVAGDFIGFTDRQLQLLPLAVNDFNRAPQISEKLAQSIIDFMALETITRGPMATSPEFSYNGTPVIDPSRVYYVGGSLGGIMGNVIMAYDPNLLRGILAVPGGNWSLLVERSFAWYALKGSALGSYTDPEVYELLLDFLGMGLEPYDAITTAANVLHDNLPGVPAKTILMWYANGDCMVTNLATEMTARTMGIDLLAPSVKMPYGMAPTPGPLVSGINSFDAHPTPMPPDTNVPPSVENGTHAGINYKPAPLRFVGDFLLQNTGSDPNGTIVPECLVNGQAAPCDCATGACD
ncbi:MAG: alpha/beta hydrolase family protein [Acidobacteriota bacterium]